MPRKMFPVLLSKTEHQQLSDLAYTKRVSMAELVRQWIAQEWAKHNQRK